jgi:PKD repeat protein
MAQVSIRAAGGAKVRVAKPRNPNAATPNQPPIAMLTVVSARYESEDVIVSTAGTRDPEGGTVSGTIDWGDDETTTYLPAKEGYAHLYAAAGTYTLTLTVRDSVGAETHAIATVTLVVEPDPSPLPDPDDPPGDPAPENVSPVVVLTYTSGQFAGQPYTFSTVGSADPDGSLADYTMDWGDDTEPDTGVLIPDTLTHTYALAGTYTATLTVTDDGSPALSGSAVRTVTIQSSVVANQAPICSVALVSGFYTGTFTFALTAHDADGAIGSYIITHGDGTASGTIAGSPPATYTHTYGTAHASRTLTLTVSDGSLTTSRSVTFAVLARPATVGGAHAYFESLQAHASHARSWSLRTQAQLDALLGVSTAWAYVYGADDYATPQDGAKLTKVPNPSTAASDALPLTDILRFPLGYSDGQTFITWDWWPGEEFRTNIGGVGTWKHFQVRDSTGSTSSGTIFDETRSRWTLRGADPEVAKIDVRAYYGVSGGFPEGVTAADPYTPHGLGAEVAAYGYHHSKWGRWFIEIQRPMLASAFTDWNTAHGVTVTGGPYEMFSLGFADEDRDPVWLLYKVPRIIRYSHLAHFDFQCGTSSHYPDGQTGTLYAYARNVAILRNPGDISSLLVKPV